MEYDVFISYAHFDNETHGNWIHEFEDRLARDYRARTGQTLKVFLDKDGLNTGHVLSDRLKQAMDNSALLLPILSPVYLSSPWCRKEFLYFMERTGDGLIVEGNSRIVPVRLMPYDAFQSKTAAEKQEAEQLTGFLGEKEILYADFYRGPLPVSATDPAFNEKIAGLSDDVFKTLGLLRKREETAQIPPQGKGPGLFLGYAYGEAKKLRDQLAKELQQYRKYDKLSARLLPEDTPDAPDPRSLPEKELGSFLRSQLAASDMAVFFYDDVEGAKPADNPRAPIAHLQYRLALEMADERKDFHIFYVAQISEDGAASQRDFVEKIDAEAKTNPRVLPLPAFELKAVRDFLLEYLQKPPSPPPSPAGAHPRVFYVHHSHDKDDKVWARIDDLMYNNRFEVFKSVFPEDDPLVDADKVTRDFWLLSQKALVLLRNGTPTWCNAQKIGLIKTASEKKSPYGMAICVAEPDVAARIREVRSHDFKVIDCAQPGFEQEILTFLNESYA